MTRQQRIVAVWLAIASIVALVLLGAFNIGSRPSEAVSRPAAPGLSAQPSPSPDDVVPPPDGRVETAPPGEEGASAAKPLPPLKAISVKFSTGTSRSERQAVLARYGFRLLRDIPAIGWASAEPVDDEASVDALVMALGRDARVADAEKQVRVFPDMTPSDPRFSQQWGYRNDGTYAGTVAGADGKIADAWDWSRGDGAVIAVSDTGVDFSHPDLAGKMHPASWDFLHDDATVYDVRDGDKHGTHVAGTAAATTNNGIGGAGTGYNASIMALKFLDPWSGGLVADGAAAIVHAADNGADVVNCSWGSGGYTQVLADAVNYAASKGVLVVASAGNATTNIDVTPTYPASLTSTNVISVASVKYDDTISSFSNYGATSVDLGAPGENIVSTQPSYDGGLLVDGGGYKIAYLTFPAESVVGVEPRNSLISRCMSELATSTTSPVIVVDDSWPTIWSETVGGRLTKYTAALQAAGYSDVQTWSVQASGMPTITALTGKTVVWFTGATTIRYSAYRTPGAYTLTAAERGLLGEYLSGGGRLLMSSGDLAYDMAWIGGTAQTFFEDRFHAVYCDNDSWSDDVAGLDAGPLSGMNLALDDWRVLFDAVLPKDPSATTIARWPSYAEISGTSMASPHVSGTLALMYSRTPTLTATVAKQRLLSTADPIPALAGKTVTGARLDAAEAVGRLAAPEPLQVGLGGVGSQILWWRNPADADLASVRLLSRVDTFPVSAEDASATILYEGLAQTAESTGLVTGSTVHYAAYARNALGSWSLPARLATTVAEPPGDGVPIPLGTDVSVTTSGVTASFDQVSSPGWLSITRITPRIDAPPNFQWQNGGYYDIHVVGEVSLPVRLEIPYDPATAPADLAMLRFFHREGESWHDITTGVDPERQVVIASTSSFSDFGLAGPAASEPSVPLSLEQPMLGAVLAALFAGAMALGQRRGMTKSS